MSLLDLPNELLGCISDNLESQSDLNSLAQANHRLHRLNNRELYRRNVRNSNSSALIWAAEHGRVEVVQKVLQEHTDKQARINVCKWPLCVAAEHGHVELVKVFLETGVDINVDAADLFTESDCPHGTPLYRACEGLHEELVLFLINKGADVNLRCSNYGCQYALSMAAEKGHERIVRALLSAGADIDAVGDGTSHPKTALSAASGAGHISVVRLLLKHGADINVRYQYYWCLNGKTYDGSPLILPVCRGDTPMVKLLLEHGVDTNVSDGIRGNILQVAVDGNEEIMTLLLDTGLDVNAQSEHYLERRNPISTVRSSALYIAAIQGRTEMVNLLLERGADVNLRGGAHGSALCAAVSKGHESTVEALTRDRSTKADQQKNGMSSIDDFNKSSALCLASELGHVEIAKLLLERGAGAKGEELLYNKALVTAAYRYHQYRREMVILLLKRRSDWTVWNLSSYSTLFETTTDSELYDIVELLIEVGASFEKALERGEAMPQDERVLRIVSEVISNQSAVRVWLDDFNYDD